MSPAKPKPPTYGKPEKRHPIRLAAKWFFVILGVIFIGWLIHVAKPMHNLTCDNPNASLIEWGTCHDE